MERTNQDSFEQQKEESTVSNWKTKWLAELKKWPQNFNTAIALVTILIPNTLLYVSIINETVQGPGIKYYKLVFSCILGFIVSAFFHGGGLHFQSFTLVQSFVLMVQVKAYGKRSLPTTVIGLGVFMLIMIFMRLHKIIKAMPYCILIGFRFSLGRKK